MATKMVKGLVHKLISKDLKNLICILWKRKRGDDRNLYILKDLKKFNKKVNIRTRGHNVILAGGRQKCQKTLLKE